MKSSKEERLILENLGLVRYLSNQFTQDYFEYEDIVSIGTIGLIKASKSFDEQKKIKYAGTCIKNEIKMYYRKTKKLKNEVSMEEPIAKDCEGGELLLENVIADKEVNVIEEIQNRKEAEKTLRIMLNYLQGKERLALLYRMGERDQREVAELLGVSQSYISRLEKKRKMNYEKLFSLEYIMMRYFLLK